MPTVDGGRVEQILPEVEDEGTGVSPKIQDRIFETFFTTRPEGKGSGLGLSTVRMLVIEMGGTITLDSNSNGACFRVELPDVVE